MFDEGPNSLEELVLFFEKVTVLLFNKNMKNLYNVVRVTTRAGISKVAVFMATGKHFNEMNLCMYDVCMICCSFLINSS